jgi:hypothetical protein
MTTALHPVPSASVPGGQRGGRTQSPPSRRVPRGHVASSAMHAILPDSTSGATPPPHGAAPSRPSEVRARQEPEATSMTSSPLQARNSQPRGPMCAAGPQNASPTDAGTHAPRRGKLPSTQAHRPDASLDESRGHAAAHRASDDEARGAPAPHARLAAAAPDAIVLVATRAVQWRAVVKRRIPRDATERPCLRSTWRASPTSKPRW